MVFNQSGGGLEHDEVRYAITGYYYFAKHELLDLGVTNQPPLIKYFIGLSQVLLGVTSFAIRLPSAIFGLLTLVLVYYIAKEKWSSQVGLCSVIMFLTTYGFVNCAVRGLLDMGLTFFITLMCFIFIKFKSKPYYYILLGVVSGCVIRAKFNGIYTVIPLIVYIVYSAYSKKNIKVLLYFLALFVMIAVIYLPYLPRIDVVIKTMLYTAGNAERGVATAYGIWSGIMSFLTNETVYNPLYVLGANLLYILSGSE